MKMKKNKYLYLLLITLLLSVQSLGIFHSIDHAFSTEKEHCETCFQSGLIQSALISGDSLNTEIFWKLSSYLFLTKQSQLLGIVLSSYNSQAPPAV
jgi:hypothetical protein